MKSLSLQLLLNPNVLQKRIRSKHANWELELLLSMLLVTTNLAGRHTYTATDANGCSKSITVTINAAPEKSLFCNSVNPKFW
jgi:hypothetical protein